MIPDVLSVLLGHAQSLGLTFGPTPGSGSAATTIPFPPFTCPAGGGGQLSCDQTVILFPPSLGPPTFTVTLNNCQVSSGTGATLTFNGTLTANGQQGDTCFSIPTSSTLSTQNLTIQSQTAAGTTTASFSNFSATLALSCSSSPCQCTYDTVGLQLTGTISVVTTDVGGATSSTQATFAQGSTISITIDQYEPSQCVPLVYTMTVNGDVSLTTDGNGFQAVFTDYTLHDDATSGHDMVQVSGQVTSACLGGAVSFLTRTDLALGGACPQAGAVVVNDTDLVSYTGTGGVEIDLGDNGSVDATFSTCLDPQLFACPAS